MPDEPAAPKPWRDQATEAGYVYMPKADADSLKADANFGRDVKAKIPEAHRDAPMGFFDEAISNATKLAEFQSGQTTQVKDLETQITTLKRENTKLSNEMGTLRNTHDTVVKENNNYKVWSLINAAQGANNMMVDDMFLDDSAIGGFDLKRFDQSNEEGKKAAVTAAFNEIVKPAFEKQSAYDQKRYGSGNRNPQAPASQPQGDRRGGPVNDPRNPPQNQPQQPQFTRWGQIGI